MTQHDKDLDQAKMEALKQVSEDILTFLRALGARKETS